MNAYRASLLWFAPRSEGVARALYEQDGLLVVGPDAQGRQVVQAIGAYGTVSKQYPQVPVQHFPGRIIAPGFIDLHIHYPQIDVIGSPASGLLPWLENYTFPEENRFSAPGHSAQAATFFIAELLRNGVTTALTFATSHPESVNALFTEAQARCMRLITGLVLMDRHAPDYLVNQGQGGVSGTEQSLRDTESLIQRWHGVDRLGYAITPRFAITSTPQQMEMAQALVRAHPDCYVQTHLSENHDEIAFTRSLYPQARDYLDVYQSYGLLGPKSLLGHAIHLTPREVDALADTGSHPVFCPTSNLFLGSGLFDDAGLRARGIGNAIATDIGAGTSYSMLQTLNEGYKVLQLQGQSLHPLRAFHWITRGNAVTLGLDDKIGTLAVGSEADIVVLALGIRPNISLAQQSGLTVKQGIIVNRQLQSSDSAIYALGECIELNGETFGLVAPINAQAIQLAQTLCGKAASYCSENTATQLKISGIALSSCGDIATLCDNPSSFDAYTDYLDSELNEYRRLWWRGPYLAGAVLYGDTRLSQQLSQLITQQQPYYGCRSSLLLGLADSAAAEPAAESQSQQDAA